jgi:hypothetical protein
MEEVSAAGEIERSDGPDRLSGATGTTRALATGRETEERRGDFAAWHGDRGIGTAAWDRHWIVVSVAEGDAGHGSSGFGPGAVKRAEQHADANLEAGVREPTRLTRSRGGSRLNSLMGCVCA